MRTVGPALSLPSPTAASHSSRALEARQTKVVFFTAMRNCQKTREVFTHTSKSYFAA